MTRFYLKGSVALLEDVDYAQAVYTLVSMLYEFPTMMFDDIHSLMHAGRYDNCVLEPCASYKNNYEASKNQETLPGI